PIFVFTSSSTAFLFSALYTCYFFFFFFNDTATTEIYTLSLHDALPIKAVAAHDVELPGDRAEFEHADADHGEGLGPQRGGDTRQQQQGERQNSRPFTRYRHYRHPRPWQASSRLSLRPSTAAAGPAEPGLPPEAADIRN